MFRRIETIPWKLNTFLLLLSLSLSFCSHYQRKGLPSFERANNLRGATYEDVQKALGPANDTKGMPHRAFWFLSEEPETHPNPVPRLYEFRFVEGSLSEIKLVN